MLFRGTDLDTKNNSKRELKVVARVQELVWHPRGFCRAIILVQLFDSLTAVHTDEN